MCVCVCVCWKIFQYKVCTYSIGRTIYLILRCEFFVACRIKWICDICGSEEHSATMVHARYQQQFKQWRMPLFCASRSHQTLQLPMVQCLRTSMQSTPQYNLLPDLGMYVRGILQRRFYSETVRKHWIKTASMHQPNNGSSAEAVLGARTRMQWRFMHGQCANLLVESMPCMRKSKRGVLTLMSSSSASDGHLLAEYVDAVEIMACINVMHGTLLKLYTLGAKTPTFNARVHLLSRMMEMTTHTTTDQQLRFMQQHPALMRICFMEYTINAMEDWLPCERVLLFSDLKNTPAHSAAMTTYSNIAVAMCDIFRQVGIYHQLLFEFESCFFEVELFVQDAIITGTESWHSLNALAAIGIERCVRVCKFKLFRVPEPMVRGPHLQPENFLPRCMDGRMFAPSSMDLAMHLCGGDRDSASQILSVHSNLQVFALPVCVAEKQLDSMDRIHSGCSAKLRACQRITFCSVCAINGKVINSIVCLDPIFLDFCSS